MKEWFNEVVAYVKKNKDDIIRRAVKTFFQAFLSSLTAGSALLPLEMTAWKAALIGAAASGISAVWNAFLPSIMEWLNKLWDEGEDEDNGNSET